MKTKKFLSMLIAVVIIAAMFAGTVSAANYTVAADDLNSLGLFIGTADGYELDREPTRAEAAVMLVRLLGKEAAAKSGTFEHPFTDVPDWADPYIGYLYKSGLTNGISKDKFGSDDLCDGNMFCTFILRALGYTEKDGDFTYDTAVYVASGLQLVSIDMFSRLNIISTRDDCVYIMHRALLINIKGTDMTLLEKLVEEGAVSAEAAAKFMEKFILLDELSETLATSVAAMTARAMVMPFSIDFEAITFNSAVEYQLEDLIDMLEQFGYKREEIMDMLEEELEAEGYTLEEFLAELSTPAYEETMKATLTVVGEDIAFILTMEYVNLIMNISAYYTDGYIYVDSSGYMYGQSIEEKLKQEIEFDELISSVGVNTDMTIRETVSSIIDEIIPVIMINSIEKVVSDKDTAYIIKTSDDFYGAVMEIVWSIVFSDDSISINIQQIVTETISTETQYNIKIKATGDDVKIDFPDFSDYIDYYDIDEII